MKNSKRSLIVAIAVLCVCALSLSTATFAWFTSTTQANVNDLKLSVIEQSDLKIAIDPAVATNNYSDNIESDMWGVEFSGADITDKQTDYADNTKIANATWDNTLGYFVTISEENSKTVDATTGFYNGAFTAAAVKSDYVKFTVHFRSTDAGKQIKFEGANFDITSAKEALVNGLTLRVNGEEYNNTGVKNVVTGIDEAGKAITAPETINKLSDGGVVCTIGSTNVAEKGFYTASADFYIFVEGKDAATINQNAGINFILENLSFSYVED